MTLRETLNDGYVSVVVFGPGYGESVAVRGPDGRWLVIDSLREPRSERNPAAALLREFDAEPELLVLTHDHEDHSAGFAELVEMQSGSGTRIGCVPRVLPDAADPLRNPDAGAALRQGRTRLALAAIQAQWDRRPSSRWLLCRGRETTLGPVRITALSPRAELVGAGVLRNRLSAAMLLEWEDLRVILGADLPNVEWQRVDSRVDLGAHQLCKAPHHGSKRSQHDRLFNGTGTGATWIVAPWTRAGRHVPSLAGDGDLDRLLRRIPRVELTSSPTALTSWPTPPIDRAALSRLVDRSTFGGSDLVLEYDDAERPAAESWVAASLTSTGELAAIERGNSALPVDP